MDERADNEDDPSVQDRGRTSDGVVLMKSADEWKDIAHRMSPWIDSVTTDYVNDLIDDIIKERNEELLKLKVFEGGDAKDLGLKVNMTGFVGGPDDGVGQQELPKMSVAELATRNMPFKPEITGVVSAIDTSDGIK